MPGKGIEGDRWESEETAISGEVGEALGILPESSATSTATTPAEMHDIESDNTGMENSVTESAQGMEDLVLKEEMS